MYRSIWAFSLALFFLSLSGCDRLDDVIPGGDKDHARTYYGPSTTVGDGYAKAWVKLDKDGKPEAIGMNVSVKAVESLAKQPDAMFTLPLPEQGAKTPFKTISLDWNSMGHPEVYFVPHFDVHFYMISDEERAKITGGPQENTDSFKKNYMPENYSSGMFAVPNMGVHWEDLHEPQHNGGEFTRTFIYGANNNKVIFFEPMVAVTYLQQLAPNAVMKMDVAQAPKVQKSGYYPLTYTIVHNTAAKEYSVSLTDLRYRKAK